MKVSKWVLPVLILFFAGLLRFVNLTSLPPALHWDEQDTGYQAFSLLKTGRDYFSNLLPLFPHSLSDYRTPVFIYMNVPFVALLGLTPLSVRLTPAIFGLLDIILIYLLARKIFSDPRLSWVAPAVMAVSPWHLIYSRTSVECISMLTMLLVGLLAFYKSLSRSSWLWVSGLFFGLSVASYSPAKLFTPVFVFSLLVIYKKHLVNFPKKSLLISALLFCIISLPVVYDGVFGQSGLRFHDVSITTDPGLAAAVDRARRAHETASGIPISPGMQPRLVDKILINKPVLIFSQFASNYLNTFSMQYLFTQGDPEPRHSPSPDSIGQLQLVEVLPLFLGLFALSLVKFIPKSNAKVLLVWLLLGPVSSALTRGGGPHAARTILMLPAYVLLITLGIKYLLSKSRLLFVGYLAAFTISSFFILSYFFADYRIEGLVPFNWGFSQAVEMAQKYSTSYDHIILDMHDDSGLMAYLFTTKMDPAKYQHMNPLPVTQVYAGIQGNTFGNITILFPGTRVWENAFKSAEFPQNTLIITRSDQSGIDRLTKIDQINYPNNLPAFYAVTK